MKQYERSYFMTLIKLLTFIKQMTDFKHVKSSVLPQSKKMLETLDVLNHLKLVECFSTVLWHLITFKLMK